MNCSTRLSALCLALAVAVSIGLRPVTVAAAPTPGQPNIIHLKAIILEPDGEPAADASVTLYVVDFRTNTLVNEQTVHTTATGECDIAWAPVRGIPGAPLLYSESPKGVGVGMFGLKETKVTLRAPTSVRVRMVDDLGNPVANLHIGPSFFSRDQLRCSWSPAITDRWSAVTDNTGAATLTGLPSGWTMQTYVADPAYVEPAWDKSITLANAPSTPDARIVTARAGTISGTVRFGPTGQPAVGITVEATPVSQNGGQASATTDAAGKFQFSQLAVGSYDVTVRTAGQYSNWTVVEKPATVIAGEEASGIDLSLIRGAVLTGVVSDQKTGKPIAGVLLYIIDSAGDQNATTGDDGRYTIHVPPGAQRVIRSAMPGMTPTDQQFFDLSDGETKTLNFKTTAPTRPIVVQGIVVGPTGKPVPGAKVFSFARMQGENDTAATADAQGKFIFAAPGLMPDMSVYASSGALSTPLGVTAVAGAPITVRMAANAKSRICGTLTDESGKPIPNATILLFREFTDGTGIEVQQAATTASGRYSIVPMPADQDYMVEATAKGFAYQFSSRIKTTPGKSTTMPTLRLARTDSFVGGTVVDVSGNPIVGADVSLINAQDTHVLTDKQGMFRLTGAPKGHAIIEVKAPNGRSASMEVSSGVDNNVITAESMDEQDAESKRFVAMLNADKTNHGNGANANVLLRAACKSAREGDKQVLLVFHASWCGPCFMLHRFLNDPEVKPIVDAHFTVQDIDIWENGPQKPWENIGGTDLYKQYGGIKKDGSAQGVPFFVVLDAAGKKLADANRDGNNIGFPGGDAGNAEFFLQALKNAAPDMADAELAKLKSALVRDAKL